MALKNKFNTVSKLNSVMNAILIVTAAKIHKAKSRYLHTKEYLMAVEDMAAKIALQEVEEGASQLILVIGTNKGLCGNFNDRVVSSLKKRLEQSGKKDSTAIYTVGKNLDKINRFGFKILGSNNNLLGRGGVYENIVKVAKELMDWHAANKGKVFVLFNRYKSALIQEPAMEQILPLKSPQNRDRYIVEPSREELSPLLLQHYVEAYIYKALTESEYGEHSSRMVVVKGASDTSKEMISTLKTQINKERQAAITSELSEIISSFKALGQGGE